MLVLCFMGSSKNKQEMIFRFQNLEMKPRVFEPEPKALIYYQLILALFFFIDLGLFWSKKLDVKFSRVFTRYKDTH